MGRAPRSVVAQLFAGHDLAVQRKHSLALERYFAAFCADPEQPLTTLCIGEIKFIYFISVNYGRVFFISQVYSSAVVLAMR